MKQGVKTNFSDVKLFLILIPFINIINYYLTYSNIKADWFLALTFSIDTLQGYIAWYGIRHTIGFLDQKIPYHKSLTRRIIFQIITTLLIALVIIISLTELLSWLARGKSAPIHFYTQDIFIIGIWIFVINGIYIGAYFYDQWKNTEIKYKQDHRSRSEGIMVNHGNKKLKLIFDQIAGFHIDGDYTAVFTNNSKKYYLDQSLNTLENQLPKINFFRLNRQFIINKDMVKGFKRIENGKILVLISPEYNFPSEITVSRTKASNFKKWFEFT
ncbi:hypothetical protein D1818_15335 [Aquimarina sp. BL5]|uniref:LytR/AlgR family response regulator transcription factor n=1 Tax=Aquimarina sp. BL5 TaxID=1714860 RepID=UPI000E4A53B3|nr:LytTR family DNA-binding domain-containing protein [Aquimarina sp. BL5]AXT52144.1 hypothetical protein D1818_15335 [Aquimarina sp. BL5]RKN10800.1 hypothetical protein D7036_02000 [Aquimarina sp. BL5]